MTIEIWDLFISKYRQDKESDIDEFSSISEVIYFENINNANNTNIMNLNQFMTVNLSILRDEIIYNNIPSKIFDSHEFIRHFAKKFEIEYVEFLSLYKNEPFRNVHAQIGKFLSEHQESLNIKDDGITQSPNIFGADSQNEKWIKTA
jgi:hypothetical protein